MKYIKTYENLLKGKSEEFLRTILTENELIESLIKKRMFGSLPRNSDSVCVYDGNLWLADEYLNKLPDNLTINGNFFLNECRIESLPNNLIINGDFDCSMNMIEIISDTLKVSGSLICTNNWIESLPDNLTINGDFDCSYNYIIKLPENLTVNGDFYCTKQKKADGKDTILNKLELPKSAIVKGKFYN